MRSPGFVHGLVELLHSSYLSFLERRTEKKIVKLRQKLKDATPAQSSAAAATAAAAAKSTANNTNATKMSWRARFTSPLTKNPHAYPNGPIWQKVRQVARAKGGHDINLGLDPKARRNVAIIGGGLAIAYSAFTSRLYALPYESWWRPGKTESFRAILLRELEGTPTAIAARGGRVNDLRWLPGGERGGSSSSSAEGSRGGGRSGGASRLRDTIIADAGANRVPMMK